MPAVLTARALVKHFPGVVALNGVDFELLPGEIHALCGENGAGKSTLIKLLSGIHPHRSYQGELFVDGRIVAFHSIRDAAAAGIAVITQEFALIDELSVAENIFLGRAPRRGLRIDWPELQRRTAALLTDFGLTLAPETPVRSLGIGQKQLVEIIRAIDKNSRVLVLDEPTAALTGQEAASLLSHLRRLRARGTACIYISHKLEEVFAIADRITVLRDGQSVAAFRRSEATIPLVIRHMVGRALGEMFPERSAPATATPLSANPPNPPPRQPLLAVRDLTVAPAAGEPPVLHQLSFNLHAGEILGCGGLMGAGRTELLTHLFGAWGQRIHGEVTLSGLPYPQPTPRDSLARGLAFVSEDRRRFGLVLNQSIGFNLSLASLAACTVAPGRIDLHAEYARNQTLFDNLGIRAPGQATLAGGLSGGNQQKVVLGKSLLTHPAIILLDEPTRGIDVGAKQEVYARIHQLTSAGMAVLLVSSELPELMGLSDRIIMLAAGRIAGEFPRAAFSPDTLLAAAMGHPAAS